MNIFTNSFMSLYMGFIIYSIGKNPYIKYFDLRTFNK
jgi:hypothetical protein